MTIQALEGTYRRYLETQYALSIDINGDEILVGLSWSESVEYVAVTNGSISRPLPTGHSNPRRFLELAERHEAARPRAV